MQSTLSSDTCHQGVVVVVVVVVVAILLKGANRWTLGIKVGIYLLTLHL